MTMKYFPKHISLCTGVVFVIMAMAPATNAATIYSDLNFDGGWAVGPRDGELGDQITAAGSDRLATRLSIEIYSQGLPFPNPNNIPPASTDVQAQIYANDGVQGAPLSLLWQSALVHVDYQPGLTLLNFDLPQVLVPNTFTWTMAFHNSSSATAPPALPSALTPTIGGNSSFFWFRSPNGVWTHGTGNFGAQIEAVPEPGVGAMLSAAFATWQLRKRSR
jgi:hypothetical protein